MALPAVTREPVTVPSSAGLPGETPETARHANALRADVARMSPGSRQIRVGSGHTIPSDRPEAVIAAIRAALADVREGSR